ncbi:ABC-three component system middle component 2 [Pseudomonas sp. CJQ_13]|uniref:ABC-three component system middle component 2 n=1 Tax=Pseudomonas sp. CJQ_13 TaxID=3367170 RepID=UPI00370C91C8
MGSELIGLDVFNNPVEFGARLLILLSELKCELGMDELVFFDYAMIYSADFDDKESVHPSLPHRLAELVRRREDVLDAVTLFISKSLITSRVDKSGISYSATPQGCFFVANLTTQYHMKIKRQASWVRVSKARLGEEMQRIYSVEGAAN